jgi:hypothetical protein
MTLECCKAAGWAARGVAVAEQTLQRRIIEAEESEFESRATKRQRLRNDDPPLRMLAR